MGDFFLHSAEQEQQRIEQRDFTEKLETPELEYAKVIKDVLPLVKEKLSGIRKSHGEINVSAYDTAFVALIPAANGSDRPHFPCTLEWIVANQHMDGSWGDNQKDWLYDRFIHTLACIVTLKFWNRFPALVRKGADYITRNADKLQDEEILSMPIGFELSFPGLLGVAEMLDLDLPYNTPVFGVLDVLRNKTLQRVSLELLHSQQSMLLHNLEALQTLAIDWKKLLRFQSEDGSICCSPSSTAVMYMKTKDKKCLSFLETVIQKFNNAVPTCYPLDTFHNLCVVDTLERLGISRYFQDDIEYILAEVYRHWKDEQGICWASVLRNVPDLDDTSVAFRLLRQHGYNVSAEGFKVFQTEQGFSSFAEVGQMVQDVSVMFNLLRASQIAYPGEERLVAAESFSRGFLVDTVQNSVHADKWSHKKDLPGEIVYALGHSEHKNFNRMHIRQYLDKYGPEDCWIGKAIYRLHLVNNPDLLKLAKADFNLCQKSYQQELSQVLRWMIKSGLADNSSLKEEMVRLYSMSSAELWEPEFSTVRIAAGKCMFIARALRKLFLEQSSLTDLRQFVEAVRSWDPARVLELPETFKSCFKVLFGALVGNAAEPTNFGGFRHLLHMWEELLSSFLVEAEWRAQRRRGNSNDAQKKKSIKNGFKAVVFSSILMSGENQSEDMLKWMEKESILMETASDAVILAQSIASRTQEPQFTLIMKQQQKTKELNLLRWGQTSVAVPPILKRVALTFVKVANVYYDDDYEKISAELASTINLEA